MIEFLLGIVAGFTVTAVAAAWVCHGITGAFTQIMNDQSQTICRMREELNELKQEKPLAPGWDKECERWKWGNN